MGNLGMRKLSQRRGAATFHTTGGAVYIVVLGISGTCAVHNPRGHSSQLQRSAGKTTDPGELPSFFALCCYHLRSIWEPLKYSSTSSFQPQDYITSYEPAPLAYTASLRKKRCIASADSPRTCCRSQDIISSLHSFGQINDFL